MTGRTVPRWAADTRGIGLNRSDLWQVVGTCYVVALFALPQYFGIPLPGFALTAQRIVTVALILMIVFTREKGADFSQILKGCTANIYILPMLLVYAYTAIAVKSPNSVLGHFADAVCAFYLIILLAKDVFGVEGLINLLVKVVSVVCCIAIIDMLRRWNPYQLIHTIASISGDSNWRGSSYRVAAMCSHPIGFGMYLLLMLPVVSIDAENKALNLLKHPIALGLMSLAMLGTGSRGPIACFMAECLALFIMSDSGFKKSYSGTIFLVVVFAVFVLIAFNRESHINRWVWMNVFQIIDELFGTSFVLDRYGYWQYALTSNSSEYRDYLPFIFVSPDLDPFLGQGNQGDGISFTAGGYFIQSVDNFYVLQYIRYAWPGVITTVLLFVAILIKCYTSWRVTGRCGVFFAFGIAFLLYYANLWTVADLGTLKYYFGVFALVYELAQAWKIDRVRQRRVPGRLQDGVAMGR